jgi:Sodium Bile acid symporter family
MTTQPSQIVLINGFGVLFVVFNAFGLGLRLPVGKLLAQALAHWKIAVWALVINFVIIPLLLIGYLLTIASSIPGEIKVGFCVAALCAGMPFAPIVARLAKANVTIATTLLVVLTVATIIALPLGLPSPSTRLTRNSRPLSLSGILLGRCCFSCCCLWFWGVASGSGGPTWRHYWNGGLSGSQFYVCS